MIAYEEIDVGWWKYALYAPISCNPFHVAYWIPYREDGSLASINDGSWKGTGETLWKWMQNNPIQYKNTKLFLTFYAEITPVEGLIIRSQVGLDYTHTRHICSLQSSWLISRIIIGTAGRTSSMHLIWLLLILPLVYAERCILSISW